MDWPTVVKQSLHAVAAWAVFLVLFSARLPAADGELTVRDIRVEGLQRIAEGTVFNYLPVNFQGC
jgi:outer membrane protein insertion porin family